MLNTVDKVLFLMRTGVTGDASTDALSRLSSVAHEVEELRGKKLFTPGDEADALYIVVDGVVRVDVEGAPPRLAGAGDWLGAMPLFTGGPHRGTATVLVTTHFLRIDRSDVQELLDEDGELARALFSGLLRTLTAIIPSASEAA